MKVVDLLVQRAEQACNHRFNQLTGQRAGLDSHRFSLGQLAQQFQTALDPAPWVYFLVLTRILGRNCLYLYPFHPSAHMLQLQAPCLIVCKSSWVIAQLCRAALAILLQAPIFF